MTDDDATTPAERAVMGEILAACPRCGDFDPRPVNQGGWACAACGHRFPEAAYFQRVPAPAPDPADG